MTRELGPRVTVAVGKGKDGKGIYSYMLKKHADFFKFPGDIMNRKLLWSGILPFDISIIVSKTSTHLNLPSPQLADYSKRQLSKA